MAKKVVWPNRYFYWAGDGDGILGVTKYRVLANLIPLAISFSFNGKTHFWKVGSGTKTLIAGDGFTEQVTGGGFTEQVTAFEKSDAVLKLSGSSENSHLLSKTG